MTSSDAYRLHRELRHVGKTVFNAILEQKGDDAMSDNPTPQRSPFGDIAPALGDYTDNVLFGDVWERPALSKRDRSLITVATLVAGYRTNELPFHLKRALENGVTRNELVE